VAAKLDRNDQPRQRRRRGEAFIPVETFGLTGQWRRDGADFQRLNSGWDGQRQTLNAKKFGW